MVPLARVLADHRVAKDAQAHASPPPTTHTSMGDPFRGSFSFPEGSEEREKLMDAYAREVDAGRPVSLVERHTPTGPVVVDVDLRLEGPERTYTEAHLTEFVNALVSVTTFYVQQPIIEVVILQKPAPRPAGGAGAGAAVYKDGWHVVLPNVVTHPAVQLAIREHFVDDMTPTRQYASTIADLPGLAVRDPDVIYDRAVIESNGWFLLGSKKRDEAHAWAVTHWFEVDVASKRVTSRDFKGDVSTRERVEALSIRVSPEGRHSPYTRNGREQVELGHRISLGKDGVGAEGAEGSAGCAGAKGDMECADVDVQHLEQLVDMLDDTRARDYASWMRVGWALSNTEGVGSREQRLDVWKAFGRRCPGKFDAAEHDRVWAKMAPRAGARAVGVGTLRFMEDSPEAYREWAKALATRSVTRALDVGQIDRSKIMEQLRSQLEGIDLQGDMLEVIDRAIRFKAADGKNGSIHKDKYIVQLEDAFYGSLVKEFPITRDLGSIRDNRFPSGGGPYNCKLLSSDGKSVSSAIIRGSSSQGDIEVKLLDMHDASGSYIYMKRGDDKAIKIHNQKVVAQLMKMVFEGQDLCAAEQYGITQNIFINNGSITINTNDDSFSEVDLVETLQAGDPALFSRLSYVPDMQKDAGQGGSYYYCDPTNNLWACCSATRLAGIISRAFCGIPEVSADQCKHVKSNRGNKALMQAMAKLVVNEKFVQKLDANPNLLAVANGVFDTSSGKPVFRALEPGDYASNFGDWEYSPEQGAAHREALMRFLRQVLPVDEEREVVLKYFAGLLSGWRREKKFLVLTDRSSGNNGKTMLKKLLEKFFGQYTFVNGKKFLVRAGIEKGRDAHDAGLFKMKGLRIVIADEMAGERLDEGMLKEITGGEGVYMEGRAISSGGYFKYMWHAGVVIMFNEGFCPKFDGGDTALVARMIVAPMRSKFVLNPTRDNEFPLDDALTSRFSGWMSALVDLLMEHYTHNRFAVFANLPASMLEWKADLTNEANPLSEWLEEVLEVTGDHSDMVWVGDLKKLWNSTHTCAERSIYAPKLVKAYVAGRPDLDWSDVAKPPGADTSKRGIIRMCKVAERTLVDF